MSISEIFFNLVDYDLLLKLAENTRVSINGFKTLSRAPEVILRKAVSAKFSNKIGVLRDMLRDLYGTKVDDFKKEDINDFIYTFLSYPYRDKIPAHAAIGMLILIFPDEAEGFSGIISENIKNGRHIFEGCIKYPALDSDNCYEEMSRILQLSDETELIDDTIINIEERLPVVNKMDDYAELMQQFKDMNFLDFINKFLSLRKQYPDYLILSSYISQNKNSISKSSGSIKEFYNKLIYNIYGAVSTETFIEFQNTIKNKDEYIAKLEKEFKQKDEFINNLNSEINFLKGKLSESETKIDEILNPPINAKADEQLAFDRPEDIQNIIISSFNADRVFDAIGSYYLINPQKLDLLEKITDEFRGTVFIERSSFLSTRELMKVEKLLSQKKIRKVVLLSSSPEELVRNIIIKKEKLEDRV
jgi:hypothetical protein